MPLLTAVKETCAVVGVLLPQSVFSGINGNRTMQEMVALAHEMAQRIAYDYRDWTQLRATATFTGDGVTTAFDLPADYQRMLLTANVWRSNNTQQPTTFVPDPDKWMQRRADAAADSAWGEWTMMGGQMHIFPALSDGETATFMYLSKNCIALNGGGYGDTFANDADSFVLGDRILRLGMIWQWKAQKGAPYAEDMGTYGVALDYLMGHDSPAPIIVGRTPISAATRASYPWPVPAYERPY